MEYHLLHLADLGELICEDVCACCVVLGVCVDDPVENGLVAFLEAVAGLVEALDLHLDPLSGRVEAGLEWARWPDCVLYLV